VVNGKAVEILMKLADPATRKKIKGLAALIPITQPLKCSSVSHKESVAEASLKYLADIAETLKTGKAWEEEKEDEKD